MQSSGACSRFSLFYFANRGCPMKVRIRFFHLLKQYARTDALEMEVPDGSTVGDIKNLVFDQFPGMKMLGGAVSLAQDMEYANPTDLAREGAEIALMPPVSGG